MNESQFVSKTMRVIKNFLKPPLIVRSGAALLYEVSIDNRLAVTVNTKKPSRGQSAFQTDLCIFDLVDKDIEIPRIVIEFKQYASTHDVLTYSTKARKHKQVYPYLRYGLVIAYEPSIPGRFFTHNDSLDFCIAAGSYSQKKFYTILEDVISKEIKVSKRLENIAFGNIDANVMRSEIVLKK